MKFLKLKKIFSSVFCLSVALLFIFSFMFCISCVKFGSFEQSLKETVSNFSILITGGLTYQKDIGLKNLLLLFSPLLCCAVAFIISYKVGLFNIGLVGQFAFGSFGSLLFANKFKFHWSIYVLIAIFFGMFFSIFSALLKVFWNVNEVISGMMLNFIVLYFIRFFYNNVFSDVVNQQSHKVLLSSFLPSLKLFSFEIPVSFFIALSIVIIFSVVINKTSFGFRINMVNNEIVTKYSGISVKKNIFFVMLISGALAGLSASLYYLTGFEEWNVNSILPPSLPLKSIVVAFVAQLSVVGSVFSTFFISLISLGSLVISQEIFSREICDFFISFIIYLSNFSPVIFNFLVSEKKKDDFFITEFEMNKGEKK